MPRRVVRGYDYLELKNSMAESRLRAPDPGARLGVPGCLGRCQKNLFGARQQPFSGKSFYLDLPAGKNLQFLTGAIQNLGGVIESFLSKEVSYIVSNRREAKAESGGISHRGCPSPGEVRVETSSMADPKHSQARLSQRHADSVPMSRGKELLQKAIRNQGSSSGGSSGSSSLLTSARSWGVRILHVDDMMVHVRQLSLGPLCVKKQESRKSEGTSPAAESRTQKVAKLKAPFLKIEDESRKFRPFHHQFKSFPEISFLGPKDASPFETSTTPGNSHNTRKPRDREPSLRSVTRAVSRRKKGYCECCQEAFDELRVHLESAQHQSFAREARSYAEVDRIIAQLNHSFADIPSHASSSRWAGSLASDRDLLSPETSPPSQPSLALGAPEQDGTEDSMKTPTEPEPAGTGEVPGPAVSCQDMLVDPQETPAPRSPARQSPLTSSPHVDLCSGLDLALVGHKRKVLFPSGNAEKRPGASSPQASFFVPRATSPCSTRTPSDKHLSLPLPDHNSRPLTSPLPLCHTQTCLSFPDALPWQPTDRPAKFWATQPRWPGGGWPLRSEDSECVAPGPVSQQADQLPSCSMAPGQLSAHLQAANLQPPTEPAESQCTSLPPLLASGGASCSRWLWAPQLLQMPCLPASQLPPPPPPSAGRELLL